MMNKLSAFFCFATFWLLALSSCETSDEGNDPLGKISEIPEITFLGVNTTEVKQFSDSLVFSIKYLDGDGDLGFESADSTTIYVTDERFPLSHQYHLPPVTASGVTLTVQGVANIVLKNIILKDALASSEVATFNIRIRDRAGNWSDSVSSPAITVRP